MGCCIRSVSVWMGMIRWSCFHSADSVLHNQHGYIFWAQPKRRTQKHTHLFQHFLYNSLPIWGWHWEWQVWDPCLWKGVLHNSKKISVFLRVLNLKRCNSQKAIWNIPAMEIVSRTPRDILCLQVLCSVQEDQSIHDFWGNVFWSREIFKCTWIHFLNPRAKIVLIPPCYIL